MRCIFLILAIIMCVSAFAACGSSGEDGDSSKNDSTNASENGGNPEPNEAYTLYDAGEVTVDVPNGWLAFRNIDVHAEENGALSTRSVTVCKGATSELDMFSKPYVKLDYQGENIYLSRPMRDFYDNVVDLDPVDLGGHTWEAFSCDSMGTPLVILYVDEGDDQFMVTVCCGTG
ncbi:MAG: hypothetical protein IJN86_02075, partial [Clostridia bacterium]|nr:hypothetical protein [Clostridia bacterium]